MACGSTNKGICTLVEYFIGELKLADIADYVLYRCVGNARHWRHVSEPPMVRRDPVAYGAANAEVIVVARFINPVDERRAGSCAHDVSAMANGAVGIECLLPGDG